MPSKEDQKRNTTDRQGNRKQPDRQGAGAEQKRRQGGRMSGKGNRDRNQ